MGATPVDLDSMDPYLYAPDFYIEITSEKFRCSPKHIHLHSYLDTDWHTKRVYRIHPFQSGIYLLFDLHKNPHYQLPVNIRDKFNNTARNRDIPIFDVSNSSYSIHDEVFHYSNTSSIYEQSIRPLLCNFPFTKIIEVLDQKPVCSRGNIAHNIGWHTMNFRFQGKINIPCHSIVTDLDKSLLRLLTKCLQNSIQNKIDPMPFGTNPKRTRDFANKLLEINSTSQNHSKKKTFENVFESMTYAITYLTKESTFLKPHIDPLNCSQKGFNAVFGIYFNMNHPTKKNTPIRLVILGYSRKSIHDFYKRLEKRNMFKTHLMSYYNLIGVRKYLTLENAITYESTKRNESCIQRLPFVDKCGFYSIFVSCIYDLLRNRKEKLCLEQLLELVLPIGWLNTGTNYYRVIKKWERHGLPLGNLTVAIVHNLITIGGSVSSGSGPRMQPYANKCISKSDIISALRCLKETVLSTNSSNNVDIQYIYKTMTKNIKYLGFIGAQHLLSILALLRVIRNPIFVREAFVLSNTNTEKRLKSFYSMSHKVTNVLYKEISNEHFNGCTRLVENLCCEFFRDIKDPFESLNKRTYVDAIHKRSTKSIRYPDSFYSTQALFIEENNEIFRYKYNSSGKVIRQTVQLPHITMSSSLISSSDFNTIMIANLPFTSSQMENMCSSKNLSMLTQETTTIEHISKRSKVSHNLEETSFDSDYEQYHKVQYDILQMLRSKNPSHSFTKFTYKNEWFTGNYLTFNSIQTLQSILGVHKRKKVRKKRKQIVRLHANLSADCSVCYTASYAGTNRLLYLSSSNPNLYLNGFVNWFPNTFDKHKRDLCAYYETKDQAIKAITIKGFIDNEHRNIMNSGHLSKAIFNLQSNYIALFEKTNEKGYQFFAIIAKIKPHPILLVPVDHDNELNIPWQHFNIKCTLSI